MPIPGDTRKQRLVKTLTSLDNDSALTAIDRVSLIPQNEETYSLEFKLTYGGACGANKNLTIYWAFSGEEMTMAQMLTRKGPAFWDRHVITLTSAGAAGLIEINATKAITAEAQHIYLAYTISDVTNALTQLDVYINVTSGTAIGERVDFNIEAGQWDPTQSIGVLGASSGGAIPIPIAVDDSAMVIVPPFLPVGGEYRAAATIYTDGDATVLQTDINGNLNVAIAGAVLNAAYGETEDEASDSMFTTAGMYGMDTEAGAGSQLRAVQVAVDNAGVSATPNVLIQGGIYKVAFDAYDDNDAVPMHMDVGGRVLAGLTDASGNRTPAGDAVARSIYTAIGDGTTTAAVTVALTALKVDLVGEGGAAISATNPVIVELTDGTAVVSPTNPLSVQLGDGTDQVNIHDATATVIDDVATNDGLQTAALLYGYDDTGAAETWRGIAIDSNGRPEIDIVAQSLTALKVSKDASANATGNRMWVASNIDQLGGNAINVNGGNRDTGTQTVTLADDDPAVVALEKIDAMSSLSDAVETALTTFTKTVAASGTPEALAGAGTLFRRATLLGKNAARTNNTGIVYLGITSGNDTQPIAINPGELFNLEAPPGEKYDFDSWYLDVITNGDGVVVIYS